MRRPGNASWPPPGSCTPVRTTASRCCSCSTVPNPAPRASTFSCGADDSAVTSSPLPRGSGVRSTCTGTPAARAVATGATWSLPERASTTSPASGSAGVVAGRSGTPAATGPTGAAVAVAAAASVSAATVSTSGRPRSNPPTASVSMAGSTTRASRGSTLTSPATASRVAGTTRGPPALCAAQSCAALSDGRAAPAGPGGRPRSVTAVASAGSAPAPGVEQHRGAERDRGGSGSRPARRRRRRPPARPRGRRRRARRWWPPPAAPVRWARARTPAPWDR